MELATVKKLLSKLDDVDVITMSTNAPVYLNRYDRSTLKILDSDMVIEIQDKLGLIYYFDISSIERITLNPKHIDVHPMLRN